MAKLGKSELLFVSTEKCGGDVASLWECTHARQEERMHLAGYLVMLSLRWQGSFNCSRGVGHGCFFGGNTRFVRP